MEYFKELYGRTRPGWFIVLNDSVNAYMVIKMYFNFFPFPISFKGYRAV